MTDTAVMGMGKKPVQEQNQNQHHASGGPVCFSCRQTDVLSMPVLKMCFAIKW
jgi:hypothetical protein